MRTAHIGLPNVKLGSLALGVVNGIVPSAIALVQRNGTRGSAMTHLRDTSSLFVARHHIYLTWILYHRRYMKSDSKSVVPITNMLSINQDAVICKSI